MSRRICTKTRTAHLFRGWKYADTTGASNRIMALRLGGSVSDARSHTLTFQSLLPVRTYLAFREKLSTRDVSARSIPALNKTTHSMVVTPLTCPSSHRTVDLVSKSHIRAEPSLEPAPTNRPVGSNFANVACECNDVCTAVGYVMLNGSAQ